LKHFEGVYGKMSADNQREFLNVLMIVVHSHRHNKDDIKENVTMIPNNATATVLDSDI
jgi:hypothetical protein